MAKRSWRVHLLWALILMKLYYSESVHSPMAGVDEKLFRKWTWLDSRGWMESEKCPLEKDTAPLSRFICGGWPIHQHSKPSRFVLWSGLERTWTRNRSCWARLYNNTTGSERMECKRGFNSIRLLTTDTPWLRSDVKDVFEGKYRAWLFPSNWSLSLDFFNRPDSEEDKTWAIEN